MTSPRKPSLIQPVAGVVLLLLAGYVGAYFTMVRPEAFFRRTGEYTSDFVPLTVVEVEPFYSIGAKDYDFEFGFSPIHWLDRRIRPRVWGPD